MRVRFQLVLEMRVGFQLIGEVLVFQTNRYVRKQLLK